MKIIAIIILLTISLLGCNIKHFEPVMSEKLTQTSYKMLKDRGIIRVFLYDGFLHDRTLSYITASGVVHNQYVQNNISQPSLFGINELSIVVTDKIDVSGVFDKTVPVDKVVSGLADTLQKGIGVIDYDQAATSTWNKK